MHVPWRNSSQWKLKFNLPLQSQLPTADKNANDNEEGEVEEETPFFPQTPLDAAILVVKVLLWSSLFSLALYAEFGAVFVCTSGFAFIWLNLGRRKAGSPSAYSVFNPNCESIDGTLTGEQIDNTIRRGIS